MTNEQFYLAIGLPSALAFIGILMNIGYFVALNGRMGKLEDRMLAIENRVNQFQTETLKAIGEMKVEIALLKQGFDIVLKKLDKRETDRH